MPSCKSQKHAAVTQLGECQPEEKCEVGTRMWEVTSDIKHPTSDFGRTSDIKPPTSDFGKLDVACSSHVRGTFFNRAILPYFDNAATPLPKNLLTC